MGKRTVGIHSLPLTFYDPPLKLHSGGESHWFVNCESIFADKKVRELVLDWWEEELRRIFPATTLFHFVGVPTGGLCWAEAIAKRFPQAICGAGHLGANTVGYTLIAVDDVYTTGASLMRVAGRVWNLIVVMRIPGERYAAEVTAWAWIPLPLSKE